MNNPPEATDAAMAVSILNDAIRRSSFRLLPFFLLMYLLSFLDRVNIGFAKESMQLSIGISDAEFAMGAGLLFLTYAALSSPSTIMMHQLGIKTWMSFLMISWGLIAAAMMFVSGRKSYYVLRLLLGAAEAGFVPSVILYLTRWFPRRVRAQVIGIFYFGAPLAFITGGPVSGFLLQLDGVNGLRGWQWVFLIEGVIAAGVGIWAYQYLDDRPADAVWLPAIEKQALDAALALDMKERRIQGISRLATVFADRGFLQYTFVYFIVQMSILGITFYLPTQVAHLLGTKIDIKVGFVSAIPWACAIAASFIVPRLADRWNAHRKVGIIILTISGISIGISARGSSTVALIALCFAIAGLISVQPVMWTYPSRRLTGIAAAGGIGLINGIGLSGGFVAPIVKNFADTISKNAGGGLYVLSFSTLIAAVFIFALEWPEEQSVQIGEATV
jgi:MFS transporter, ACS family, inner membrane transport protein